MLPFRDDLYKNVDNAGLAMYMFLDTAQTVRAGKHTF
jgi:hypothetical protein